MADQVANEEVMRSGIEKTLKLKIARNCNLELIMKDNHTIGKSSNNCIKYV